MEQETLVGIVVGVQDRQLQLQLDTQTATKLRSTSDAELASIGMLGSLVKVRVRDYWVLAALRSIMFESGEYVATADLVGEAVAETDGSMGLFQRGVGHYPRALDEVWALSKAETLSVYSGRGQAHIRIGTIHPTADVPAALLFDTFLSKNFAIVGSTGTGKTSAVALILQKIVEQNREGHIILIDPHGEYGSAFPDEGVVFDVESLHLPYWLLNYEELCDVLLVSEGSSRHIDREILFRCLQIARSKSALAQGLPGITTDTPIPYLLSVLQDTLQTEMGKITEVQNVQGYVRLRNKIAQIMFDPLYQFMFDRRYSGDGMHDLISRLLRMPASGKPVSIIDISRIPSAIAPAVVSAISRIVLEFAVWSRDERRRPIALICEEAHRYLPAKTLTETNPARRSLERVAKEGRKYGVSLGLITQRPSDLAEGALSQCGTIIALRLNNESDQDFVRNALPEGGKSLFEAIPALRNRECIISGEGVAAPIRVRLNDVAENRRPRSSDQMFSQLWTEAAGDQAMIERVVARWRTNAR